MKITITEALAEVKTIGKRIDKKKEFISQYVFRQEQVKDPLEKDGGSVTVLKRELQAIGDLQERLMRIRAGVIASNLATPISIDGRTRTVTDWLTWRKDIAPGATAMIAQLRQGIESTRQQMRAKGVTLGSASVDLKPTDIIVNVDEMSLAREAERLEETLGTLDGKLSLLNATTTIDIE